eukprot:1226662-Prymnesium_polylepis.1
MKLVPVSRSWIEPQVPGLPIEPQVPGQLTVWCLCPEHEKVPALVRGIGDLVRRLRPHDRTRLLPQRPRMAG